jgi:uncharacterized protein
MKHSGFSIAFLLCAGTLLLGQDIQVNRQNKTIGVTSEESVSADAEVAVLTIGYKNYASTEDAAFQENVRVAEKITTAFLGAGIAKANIDTEKLRLERTELDEKWTAEMKKDRQFEAQQSWKISVSASLAQGIVDLAVRSGANEVEDVDWDVIDPVGLQAKASGAALAKARLVAEQMAHGLGAKLGELVYASNRAPVAKGWKQWQSVQSQMTATAGGNAPHLTLFPQKVKADATVYAVFSIE